MNKFEKNTLSDKATALMLAILIHAALLGAMFLLGSSDSTNDQHKNETTVVQASLKSKA